MTELHHEIASILDAHERAVLATAVGDIVSAAPVFYARDGASLVLFSFLTTRKVEQLRVNPRVQLAVGMDERAAIRALQIDGRASIIRDPSEIARARKLILGVTRDFENFMNLPVACFVRVRPTLIKKVELSGEAKTDTKPAPTFCYFEFPENRSAPLVDAVCGAWRRLKLFMRALRAPFFTATLVPMALGTALAVRDGAALSFGEALWAWLAALLAHAGTNLANDYFDHRTRNDERNTSFTPVNGGSRIIQTGLWSPDKVLLTALACWAGAGGIVLGVLTIIPSSLVLGLGAAGFLLGFFYSGWPMRWAYRGLGDLAVALGFGPLVTGFAYASLAGHWSWKAAVASVPVAIMVALILFINSFQDARADAASDKRTSVVLLGTKARAFRVFAAAWVAVYLSIIALVATGTLPAWALASLVTVPLAIWAVRTGRGRVEAIYELLPINFATVGLHFAVGMLLTLGVVLQVVIPG